MNKFFALTTMFLALTGAAHAEHVNPIRSSALTQINLDSQFNASGVLSGSITLDEINKTVRLSVISSPICKAGMVCPRFLRSVIRSELAIDSVTKGNCGELVIVAKRDMRRVDGNLEVLEITDNAGFSCPSLVAVAPVSAVYKTLAPRTRVKTTSGMIGQAFRNLDGIAQ